MDGTPAGTQSILTSRAKIVFAIGFRYWLLWCHLIIFDVFAWASCRNTFYPHTLLKKRDLSLAAGRVVKSTAVTTSKPFAASTDTSAIDRLPVLSARNPLPRTPPCRATRGRTGSARTPVDGAARRSQDHRTSSDASSACTREKGRSLVSTAGRLLQERQICRGMRE